LRLALFKHDFSRLSHGRPFVAYLQLHFIYAALRDYTLNKILADLPDHVGHDAPELNFRDFAFETIPRR
jgi:hypothetical protein